jgi:HK97 family phage major capsid protein
MKNSIEIRQERAVVIEKANTLLNLAKDESRDFTADEQTSYDGMIENIDKLAKDIEVVERQEKLNAEAASIPVSHKTQGVSKETRSYSLFRAINGLAEGNLDGIEKEMHEEACNEARSNGRAISGLGIPSFLLEQRADIVQGAVDASGNIAASSTLGFADAMRQASIYNRIGANVMTGLSGNAKIPVMNSNTCSWEGEVDAAADGGVAQTKVELSPFRLSSRIDISKMLLTQNPQAEAAFVRDMGRAAATKIDAAMFAQSDVTSAPPCLGALSGVTTFTESTAVDGTAAFSDFVEAEAEMANAKGMEGNLCYVASPALLANLKSSAAVTSIKAGFEGNFTNNLINGYPTHFTTGCGSKKALMLDAQKLWVGFFGGLDVTVDPFSQAANGQVRLVLNQFVDWGYTHPAGLVAWTSVTA